MRGTLNSFQKTMVQWNELHAYNAVHAVRLNGGLEPDRLARVINAVLERRGLTNLMLEARRGAFAYAGGPGQVAVQTVGAGLAGLTEEVRRQINRAFDPSEPFTPFRCFTAPEPDGFWLGLVYFHAVADAEAIVRLVQEMAAAYFRQQGGEVSEVPELYPRRLDLLLRQHPKVFACRCLALPVQIRNLRSSCRAPDPDPANRECGVRLFTVESQAWRGIMGRARQWQVTVNDLLLATLLHALAPLATHRRLKHTRRRQLSIGCIVNVRKALDVDSRRTFGLFLGAFTVSHPVPEGVRLRQLAEDLCRQTRLIKRQRLFLGVPLELGLARLIFSFSSPERRRRFYPKHYPLWGGITNMNLNPLWPADAIPAAQDYFRAVSTGPTTPLVLSATTVGSHANLALSYRTTVYAEAAIEQVVHSITGSLAELGGGE